MEKSNKDLGTCIFVILLFSALAIYYANNLFGIIAIVSAILMVILLVQGVLELENNPSTIGLVTKLGKRLWMVDKKAPVKLDAEGNKVIPYKVVYLTEGLAFLPLRKILFDTILVSMVKREHDFKEIPLITPDTGTTEVSVVFVYVPNKEHIINYLDLHDDPIERDQMVIDWFENIIDSNLRQWALDPNEGPKNWKELSTAKDASVKMLMSRILDFEFTDIKDLRRGKASVTIEHMGIDIKRVDLSRMTPMGEVYESAKQEHVEENEKKSEIADTKTDIEKAKLLQTELLAKGISLSIEACLDKVMAWKITREANKNFSLSALAKSIASGFKS